MSQFPEDETKFGEKKKKVIFCGIGRRLDAHLDPPYLIGIQGTKVVKEVVSSPIPMGPGPSLARAIFGPG